MEHLEERHLLTGGLTLKALPDQTLLAGAPLQIPINAVDPGGHPVTFSVSSSNPAISTLLPITNPDLVLNISHVSSGQAGDSSIIGQMTIELFQNLAPNTVQQIISLTNQGLYNGKSFYRIVNGFVIQAGLGAISQTSPQIDDEFNAQLRYTSAGVVGMARMAADDTNRSDFFITQGGPEAFLDYQYTIFGRLVSDPNDLLDKIGSIPVNSSGSPTSPVTITSASITNDANDLALQISAPLGTTGTGTITVNVSDGHGGADQKTFNVTVQPDANDPGPFLLPIAPPTTIVNTPVSFQLPAFDLRGDPVTYYNQVGLAANQITSTQPISPNLDVNVDRYTGAVTVTPSHGLVGVTPMFFGVSSFSASPPQNQWPNTQMVPLFIDPATPTSIAMEAGSDMGFGDGNPITSLNNSDANHTLKFDVTGLMSPGTSIVLFDAGQQIGSGTYTGATTTVATVTVTTDGSHPLINGQHQITAKQILKNQSYTVGNSAGTVDLASQQSAPVTVTIDTGLPKVTGVSTTAAANSTFHPGQSLSIAVSFSEVVNVTGTPQLILNNGAVISYSGGSGTSTLTFVYTVAAAQNTTRLDYASAAALALNGGTIQNVNDNAAVLTLPPPGTSALAMKHIKITSSPTSDLKVTISPSSTTAAPGDTIIYTIKVTNKGPHKASSVKLSDILPHGMTLVVQTQIGGPHFNRSRNHKPISDTITTLPAGSTATFLLIVTVDRHLAAGTIVANTVTVSSRSPDGNLNNNESTASVTIKHKRR
jgi:uncharacterized repeat protein (TIGR01451 family)